MFEATEILPPAECAPRARPNSAAPAEELARALRATHGHLDGGPLLEVMIEREFAGWIALVSSFGADSVVLLDLVAQVNPATPVIFLDTGKLFRETSAYRDALVRRLGLTDVRTVRPEPGAVARHDPDGALWRRDADACCHLRKVAPLATALTGFDAWITGRKRFQGADRADLETIEAVDGRIKINPLAAWSRERIEATIEARDLPRNPLVAKGFLSIGCIPCTRRVAAGEATRAGRWAQSEKTECGIHSAGRHDMA
ncbi:MAG: phosphoadenylyl-sulfate reductase [Proteobacteria bacterium]|nr:phosphoadenylyl-sulfate reductase [Pseudomonadota bacterium]